MASERFEYSRESLEDSSVEDSLEQFLDWCFERGTYADIELCKRDGELTRYTLEIFCDGVVNRYSPSAFSFEASDKFLRLFYSICGEDYSASVVCKACDEPYKALVSTSYSSEKLDVVFYDGPFDIGGHDTLYYFMFSRRPVEIGSTIRSYIEDNPTKSIRYWTSVKDCDNNYLDKKLAVSSL